MKGVLEMHGRTAVSALLVASVVIALLLVSGRLAIEAGAAAFAVALVALGVLSRDFRR